MIVSTQRAVPVNATRLYHDIYTPHSTRRAHVPMTGAPPPPPDPDAPPRSSVARSTISTASSRTARVDVDGIAGIDDVPEPFRSACDGRLNDVSSERRG